MNCNSFILSIVALLLGFSSFCVAQEPIKLHLALHSHMDAGWIWTFEEYYQGTPSWAADYSAGCVKCILNNVYKGLLKSPERKYQIAETAFFERWWSDQPEDVRNNVRKLLKDKQLQFVNGGWTANDEACTYYEDIIDNFITGHRWIFDEFGLDPNVGWQLDSFGHSATHTALMAQAGYDGIFFSRLDYRDWDQRRRNQSLEFHWKPQNPHNESLLGHALYLDYPNWEWLIGGSMDMCRTLFCRGRLNEGLYNKLKTEVLRRRNSYGTRNMLLSIGDDFHLWRGAEQDFDGIEDLISRLNNDTNSSIIAKFSTVSEYVQETSEDYAQKPVKDLPLKEGDFFPYISSQWTSWVGYFTSKAMFKLKIRETSQYYNAAKLLFSKFLLSDNQNTHSEINSALRKMEEALGIVQHHDGITGTMKDKVKVDYDNMLDKAKNVVDKEIISLLKNYSEKVVGEKPAFVQGLDFDWRQKDPQITSVFKGQGDQANVLVTVFNPGHTDTFLLKIKSPTVKYKVLNENNEYLVVDIICNNQQEKSDCYIYFTDEIPAFSLKTYILEPSALSKVIPAEEIPSHPIKIGDQVTLQVESDLRNFSYQLCSDFDPEQSACLEDSFNLNYEYYEGNIGYGAKGPSGAYIFVPKDDQKRDFSPPLSGKIFKGRHITIIQIKGANVRTDLKFVHHELERGIEIETYFTPIEEANPSGREIVMMIRSKAIQNDDQTFFTDQNGYYMQARKLNDRDFDMGLPNPNMTVPSNYYPITSAVYVEDPKTKLRMTVVTDRSQGATSLNPGEIEIMVHRVCLMDDAKGVAERLIEKDPEGGLLKVSTRHYLMYTSPTYELKEKQRVRQYKLDRSLQYFLANVKADSFKKSRTEAFSKVLELKENIKLTIRSYNLNEYVVRLHNLDEYNSKIVQIYDLTTKSVSLLNDFANRNDLHLSSISELSLFTHKSKDQIQKNKFDPSQPDWKNEGDGQDLSSIELLPMEIRTFNIVLAK